MVLTNACRRMEVLQKSRQAARVLVCGSLPLLATVSFVVVVARRVSLRLTLLI